MTARTKAVSRLQSERVKESGFRDSGYPVIELPSFWGLGTVDDARDICWTIWALSLKCSL